MLLHGAVVCACDALLAITGLRVVGSEGGHQLRIAKAEELLPEADPSCSWCSAGMNRGH